MKKQNESTLLLEKESEEVSAISSIDHYAPDKILRALDGLKAEITTSYSESLTVLQRLFNTEAELGPKFISELTSTISGNELVQTWVRMQATGKDEDYEKWWDLLAQFGVAEIFKDKERWPEESEATFYQRHHPIALDKLNGFMQNFRLIAGKYPDVNVQVTVCLDPKQGEIIYFVISYKHLDSNVAILAPIKAKCYSASYVWINNDLNCSPSDWEKVFCYDHANPTTTISKYQTWLREDVRRFYHKSASKTRKLDAVGNMWFNVLKYIDQAA